MIHSLINILLMEAFLSPAPLSSWTHRDTVSLSTFRKLTNQSRDKKEVLLRIWVDTLKEERWTTHTCRAEDISPRLLWESAPSLCVDPLWKGEHKSQLSGSGSCWWNRLRSIDSGNIYWVHCLLSQFCYLCWSLETGVTIELEIMVLLPQSPSAITPVCIPKKSPDKNRNDPCLHMRDEVTCPLSCNC